jgi:hypothetical protein
MNIVIQCAASKQPGAGFLRTRGGKRVLFVANPNQAPKCSECHYARPDDPADNGETWRETLVLYNKTRDNPFGLCQAYELYENDLYRRLVHRFGIEKTFILSAGWGLINAAFLTPNYDITFSANARSATPYKFRYKTDVYRDFRQLPADTGEPIIFFGGKDYVPLFCSLTENIKEKRFLFYNSRIMPRAPGCMLKRFDTTTRTNWHYECASAFINGKIGLD